MRRCDIIVPVYNAYDCLEPCIESILKNTDFKTAHLFLIDDKSPDKRVVPLLLEYGRKHSDKITVLLNDENLGFVKTINKGVKQSKHDVLLLNSDTEVTEGWLDGLRKCAYQEEMVATVTPLSNNLTPLRIPFYNLDNAIPEGYSLKDLALLVKRCSIKLYPEIPSSHGFCMYVRREALNAVGLFDEETFGRGYGEENDFSFRCFKYGFRHILCDDVYVFHKGTQSFLEDKQLHNDELALKYPIIWERVDEWFRKNDLKRISNNVALAIETGKKRGNILYLTNELEEKEGMINKLREDNNIHLVLPNENCYVINSYFEKVKLKTAVFERPMRVEQEKKMYSTSYARMIEFLLENYGISLVYADSFEGHFLDVIKICKQKKIIYLENSQTELKQACKKNKIKSIRYEVVRDKMLEYDFMMNCDYIGGDDGNEQTSNWWNKIVNRIKRGF